MYEYMMLAHTVSKMAMEDGVYMEMIVVDTEDRFVMAIKYENDDGEILYLNEVQFREFINDKSMDY